jgi:hypothetical protein
LALDAFRSHTPQFNVIIINDGSSGYAVRNHGNDHWEYEFHCSSIVPKNVKGFFGK